MKRKESEHEKEIIEKLKKGEHRLHHHIGHILKKEELEKLADIHLEWFENNRRLIHKYLKTIFTILHGSNKTQ